MTSSHAPPHSSSSSQMKVLKSPFLTIDDTRSSPVLRAPPPEVTLIYANSFNAPWDLSLWEDGRAVVNMANDEMGLSEVISIFLSVRLSQQFSPAHFPGVFLAKQRKKPSAAPLVSQAFSHRTVVFFSRKQGHECIALSTAGHRITLSTARFRIVSMLAVLRTGRC
ncbi:hypothetical protein Hypma_014568 [Hypsizygus marmoreus]|uniref:Uncharacterized protein n=1 Tax=Hypsizygus marmoreus TaxID=39966 RepID=A0A369J9X1_HYPMA|nr:hypothetical protein Hypma_014568 [Hypsizygus marmoreus]